ncbi:hypothetical protein [Peribacillus simplex]|uniref:hypothetical protein n=1 Tax=Peribacillus simplex TaxID=1478 RepID=UPI00366CAA4F
MWVITTFTKVDITMYEFETEQEAQDTLNNIHDYAILSEVIYFNDAEFSFITE